MEGPLVVIGMEGPLVVIGMEGPLVVIGIFGLIVMLVAIILAGFNWFDRRQARKRRPRAATRLLHPSEPNLRASGSAGDYSPHLVPASLRVVSDDEGGGGEGGDGEAGGGDDDDGN